MRKNLQGAIALQLLISQELRELQTPRPLLGLEILLHGSSRQDCLTIAKFAPNEVKLGYALMANQARLLISAKIRKEH